MLSAGINTSLELVFGWYTTQKDFSKQEKVAINAKFHRSTAAYK
jgi:hypothetical protein